MYTHQFWIIDGSASGMCRQAVLQAYTCTHMHRQSCAKFSADGLCVRTCTCTGRVAQLCRWAVCTHMHMYMHRQSWATLPVGCVHAHAHVPTHARTHADTHTRPHSHAHTVTHTYMYTKPHTHTHIVTQTHARTHALLHSAIIMF